MLDAQNSHCPTPEVQIRTVAAIPDQPPDYYSSTNADGMYTSYQAESLYATDHNSVAMPIAGQVSGGSSDVDTVAVIKLAPPSTTRKHKIKGSRAGKAPELPKPAESYIDGGKVAKLLKFLLLPIVPFRAADGSQIFQVSAEYHYALTRPAKPEDTLRLGVNPWEKSGLISSQPAMVNTYTEDTKQAN